MALVLRRSTSEHVPEWNRDKFWTVLYRGLSVGAITQKMGPSDAPPRWSWSLIIHAPGLRNTGGNETTREAAMDAFRKAFDRRINEIGEEGWADHVQHMRELEARSGPKRY
jgi:hypothetical protein